MMNEIFYAVDLNAACCDCNNAQGQCGVVIACKDHGVVSTEVKYFRKTETIKVACMQCKEILSEFKIAHNRTDVT